MANKKNRMRKRIKPLYSGNQHTCPSSLLEDHVADKIDTITSSTKFKLSKVKTLENDDCNIFMNLSVYL